MSVSTILPTTMLQATSVDGKFCPNRLPEDNTVGFGETLRLNSYLEFLNVITSQRCNLNTLFAFVETVDVLFCRLPNITQYTAIELHLTTATKLVEISEH